MSRTERHESGPVAPGGAVAPKVSRGTSGFDDDHRRDRHPRRVVLFLLKLGVESPFRGPIWSGGLENCRRLLGLRVSDLRVVVRSW